MGAAIRPQQPLRDRVLAQAWARSLITQPFANEYAMEPVGWLAPSGDVSDAPIAAVEPKHLHRGIDFGVTTGTLVTNALAGMTTYAEWSPYGYGLLVAIEGRRYKCRYAHLSQVHAVLGQWAHAGDLLGLSGSTGNSTGPHLHFEVYDKVRQMYVDPLKQYL